MFHDILEWKNLFVDHKYNNLKKLKISNFPEGVSQWFRSKHVNFSTLLL